MDHSKRYRLGGLLVAVGAAVVTVRLVFFVSSAPSATRPRLATQGEWRRQQPELEPGGSRARLPVLMYHRIANTPLPGDGGRLLPTSALEAQLRYLRDNGFTTLRASDYEAIADGNAPCPPRPIMLTFDDGYDDTLFEAYPLLRRYGMKGTVFVIVGSVGAVGHMTWPQLERIDPDILEVGAHTVTHPALAGVSPRILEREVVRGRYSLEFDLGRLVTSFAYPYGSHDDAAVAAVEGAGYRVAFTTERGTNDWRGSPFRLRRIAVPRGMTLRTFAARIGGPPPAAKGSQRAD